MIELIITILFVIGFYRLNVSLDKDIFEQYNEVERELKWVFLYWKTIVQGIGIVVIECQEE